MVLGTALTVLVAVALAVLVMILAVLVAGLAVALAVLATILAVLVAGLAVALAVLVAVLGVVVAAAVELAARRRRAPARFGAEVVCGGVVGVWEWAKHSGDATPPHFPLRLPFHKCGGMVTVQLGPATAQRHHHRGNRQGGKEMACAKGEVSVAAFAPP